MSETLTIDGREVGFDLITPRAKLYPESARFITGFASASRDFLRKGMWGKLVGGTAQYPQAFTTLVAADEADYANDSFAEFCVVWQDGDQGDVRWSDSISVLCPSYGNFTAKTKLFVAGSIVANDPLIVEANSGTVAGDYGKLREAVTGEAIMAKALHVGSDWLAFRTIAPVKFP